MFADDSNINHEQTPVADYGAAPFLGARFYRRSQSSRIQFEYDIGFHRYARTDQWNRISQYTRGSWKPRLKGRWNPDTIGEVSIKGTSEDRDLSNRYTLRQELGYEIAKDRELTFYGAYRRRDYTDNRRDSDNPFAGVEFTDKFTDGRKLKTDARLELNATRDARYRYRRLSLQSDYEYPVQRRGKVEMGAQYRPTWYTNRTISSHSPVLRMDQRWILDTAYDHRLRNNTTMRIGYEFETRSSNERDKGFNAHLLTVTLRRTW